MKAGSNRSRRVPEPEQAYTNDSRVLFQPGKNLGAVAPIDQIVSRALDGSFKELQRTLVTCGECTSRLAKIMGQGKLVVAFIALQSRKAVVVSGLSLELS